MINDLKILKIDNAELSRRSGLWNVTKLPVRIVFQSTGSISGGWYLFSGILIREGANFSSRLAAILEGGSEKCFLPLPISRKGTIFELLQLPDGVVQLELEPMQSSGSFQLKELAFRPVNMVERNALMLRRVVPLLWDLPKARRDKVGLNLFSILLRLRKSYQIAGNLRAYSPTLNYDKWLFEFDRLTVRDKRLILKQIEKMKEPPSYTVYVQVTSADKIAIQRTLKSLDLQFYKYFNVIVVCPIQYELDVDDFGPFKNLELDSCEKIASHDRNKWAIFIEEGVQLSRHSIYWFSELIKNSRNLKFAYSDHDYILGSIRSLPNFKPDWSLWLLRSTNYIQYPSIIRGDVFLESIELEPIRNHICGHDLYLRVSELISDKQIAHIPALLAHLPLDKSGSIASRFNCVQEHLDRLNVRATVSSGKKGHSRLRYNIPKTKPKISIIVPTRDALEYLGPCVESVLQKSTYRNFELIVVDNQSAEIRTKKYLKEIRSDKRVRVLPYRRPFNFSAINNFAVRRARGEVVCLLNNDTQIISEDWLEEMVGHLLQPKVGVVGAKLYYGDGRVQHAGDVVGPGGCAHHLHSFLERDAPGYMSRAILAQDLSSVTAACLMTYKSLFQTIGGFDRINLPIAFNDVDFCLRIREHGFKVVWTPYAELFHYESVSRGKDDDIKKKRRAKREVTYMKKRWRNVMKGDPFYNPNLSYERPDFSLNSTPLIKRPWL